MGGLHSSLTSVPRLATPRQLVPKGTVGIAAGQTGVYPLATPGGWHLLGRTPSKLFDASRDPPALLAAGDEVKFVPTMESEETVQSGDADGGAEPPSAPATPWVKVLSQGPMTTVQDLGRRGYARHGVSRSGAADNLSLRMGNALLGNAEGAAALEVAMGGLRVRCQHPCAVALTGADCAAKLHRHDVSSSVPTNEVVLLRSGDELEFGFAKDGARAYVCVQGGVEVSPVLGSFSTDVRAGMGGFLGRLLQAGDTLGRADVEAVDVISESNPESMLRSVHDPLRERGKVWQLRVLPGPGDPGAHECRHAPPADLQALTSSEFSVLPRSDRMAVCLSAAEGEGAEPLSGGEQMSEPCVSGTVQLPPDGNPLILLAEHQTTGGYKVPAVVIQADLWQVGQMQAGDRLRFVSTTQEDAVEALNQMHEQSRATEPRPNLLRILGSGVNQVTDASVEVLGSPATTISLRPRTGSALGRIDLNADAGEGFDDVGLLEHVTSVNIACGGHAGSTQSISQTVAHAAKCGAGIGAHVSFVDREHFGRRPLDTPAAELREQVLWQASALMGLCRGAGTRVSYIKPHGALYHAVMAGGEQAQAVADAANALQLPLLLMPQSTLASFGEGFAERRYDGDLLRSREKEGALIHSADEAAQQAVDLAARPNLHSICVHGDSPNAVPIAATVRAALEAAGYRLGPFL